MKSQISNLTQSHMKLREISKASSQKSSAAGSSLERKLPNLAEDGFAALYQMENLSQEKS